MQLNPPKTNQGSFGVPPHIKEAAEKFRAAKEEAQNRAEEELEREPEYDNTRYPPPSVEESEEDATEEPTQEDKPASKEPTALELLEQIGVSLEDEDFHKIVFRGFLEKDVTVIPAMGKARALVATFKTLNGQEYDLVDELMAEDLRDMRMTNEGYNTRRNMWVLVFGIAKLDGKPVGPTVYMETVKGKHIDAKATARRKRDVLGLMNPAILSKMILDHATFSKAIADLISMPDSPYIKKS